MPNPATPLDLEPAIYKGLGATALLRTLIAAVTVWLVPSIVAAVVLADGFACLMAFMFCELALTVLTIVTAAGSVRNLQRGRPYNWINRRLAHRFPAGQLDLVRRTGKWSF